MAGAHIAGRSRDVGTSGRSASGTCLARRASRCTPAPSMFVMALTPLVFTDTRRVAR